jgi:hypothetical protein
MFRVSAIAAVLALGQVLGLVLGLAAAHAQAPPPPPLGQAAAPPQAAPGAQVGAHPAAPGEGCFNRQEQRAFILQGRVIRLGFALRAIRAQDGDELLRAELCRNSSGLVYVLTILSRSGKVSRAAVDARTGAVVKER